MLRDMDWIYLPSAWSGEATNLDKFNASDGADLYVAKDLYLFFFVGVNYYCTACLLFGRVPSSPLRLTIFFTSECFCQGIVCRISLASWLVPDTIVLLYHAYIIQDTKKTTLNKTRRCGLRNNKSHISGNTCRHLIC